MHLSEILTLQRVVVDPDGSRIPTKDAVLRLLAELIAPALTVDNETVYRLLMDREKLQSTGIGDGVAIPHASTESVSSQSAALLISPQGVSFEAIDNCPVKIVFGVVGPRRATGDHLRTLARISRLLRDAATRGRLIDTQSAEAALAIVSDQDANL